MSTKNFTYHVIRILVVFVVFDESAADPITTTSATVNSESSLGVITSKVEKLESKIDMLLMFFVNKEKDHRLDINMGNHIGFLSSKLIKIDNEIDELKSALTVSLIDEDLGPSWRVSEKISTIHSKVIALQSSFEKEKTRITKLEQRLQGLTGTVSNEEIGQDFNICDFGDPADKDIVSHLGKVNSNIFLRKPSNASSVYSTKLVDQIDNAVDGDTKSYYASKAELNPWFFVDLEVFHFIWEIRVTVREVTRAGGIRVYVAKDMVFGEDGKLHVQSLPLFNDRERTSVFTTLIYKRTQGMCGRYVIIRREVAKELLIINELQGSGYAFE